jgi:tripartite-type tricarboxylate transporter receptor subunit TctC
MKIPRRQFLSLAAGAAASPAVLRVARAQAYPTRPITMIVTTGAGGITDVIGRVVADRMRGPLGQPIIIENITGADGNIATGRAARARPDGYTIVFGNISTHVLNAAFYSLPYDVVNDFAPVAALATAPYVLYARKSMSEKDLTDLIAWLKANPNRASMGAVTGSSHLLSALLRKETGTQFALVPCRGVPPAMQDLASGQIDLAFSTTASMPLVRAGSIKAFAVTSDTRSAAAPDIPTFAEMGLPALSYSGWGALFAPKGTPRDIIAKLNSTAVEALADPAVRSRLVDLGSDIFARERQTPEALAAIMKGDIEKWWPIIKEFGIKAE